MMMIWLLSQEPCQDPFGIQNVRPIRQVRITTHYVTIGLGFVSWGIFPQQVGHCRRRRRLGGGSIGTRIDPMTGHQGNKPPVCGTARDGKAWAFAVVRIAVSGSSSSSRIFYPCWECHLVVVADQTSFQSKQVVVVSPLDFPLLIDQYLSHPHKNDPPTWLPWVAVVAHD